MKRYKHTLSHFRMVTGNMGELMPVQCVPVLPGDTMQGHTSALIRVSPMNTPVMHPVTVRTHTFFVPNRIIWPEWEDFITGGNDGAATDQIPTFVTDTLNNHKKTIGAYCGLPPLEGMRVSLLPTMACNAIFNEYYRDQDMVQPVDLNHNALRKIAWEKDYFSTARPWTQRGPDVSIPFGDQSPVMGTANSGQVGIMSAVDGNVKQLGTANTTLEYSGVNSSVNPPMYVDLTDVAPSVNDFRTAFALQRYQEARARYGARFTEYLRYLGITPSDARLQRPEFLGGGTARLSFSEVLQTAPNNETGGNPRDEIGVGDMYGHGIAGLRTGRWRKFFEEHGYVITMLSVRPKSIYMNGVHREWLKTTKEDFFQKELANLGQQEVYSMELHGESDPETVFGYQDRYQEYRGHPSSVSQDFRDELSTFHLARDLQADQALNEAFTNCTPSRRIFQVTNSSYDTLWCMVNNHLVARRLVPKRANPRIL